MMPGGCFFWRAAVSDAGTYAGNQTAACAASGLHLGTVKKEPAGTAHALALAISPQEACHSWNLSVDEARARIWPGRRFRQKGRRAGI